MKKLFFNRWVFERFGKVAAAISTMFSIAIIYVPAECQPETIWVLVTLLVVAYIVVVVIAVKKKSTTIHIRNTKVVIKQGDIFTESGNKVIPMNEYFDTAVGTGIVEASSLHGQYITQHANMSSEQLQNAIVSGLKSKMLKVVDARRDGGVNIQYELGTIFNDKKGFFLLAYSRFDDNNRAFLKNEDIVRCYMNMWNEIDIYRGNDSVNMPILGAGGLVRFSKDYTTQQLIELIIWSFRVSGINLSKNATLNIIVHKDSIHDVDFLKLSYYSD